MRKLLFLIPLLFVSACIRAEDQLYPIDQDNGGFGGGIDYVSADKQGPKYSRIDGIMDVRTDRYNEITKREGTVKYNSTATTGEVKHRRAYTYNQADGDSYIIVQSSNCLLYSNGDGSFSTIISTLSDTVEADFTTAGDCLYWTDGTHRPGKWDGTTHTDFIVGNSTGYPTYCKYIINWRSRNWMSGDTRYKTRVYYSAPYVIGLDTGAYENYPTANYIDLGTSDGDIITGMQVTNTGSLYVYFKYKIFEITELNTAGSFGYKLISPVVGCLYNTTLDILNGFPIFLSHRGVEQFDGSNFTLRSMPIDFYVKELPQLQVSQSVWVQDIASDWGLGSGVNIDTTSYSGSVAIINGETINSWGTGNITAGNNSLGISQYSDYRMKFVPSTDKIIHKMQYSIRDSITIGGSTGTVTVGIYDVNMASITKKDSIFDTGALYQWTTQYITLDTDIHLIANTTYYIKFSSVTVAKGVPGYAYDISNKNSWPYNTDIYTGGAWASLGQAPIYFEMICATSAFYTSQAGNAGTSWGSWGTFSVDQTVPSNSDIDYYFITSTSSYNLKTNANVLISPGSNIPSAVGPYIQIISSFTRTDTTAIPKLNKIVVTYYGTNNNVPYGKVFKDAYYLAVNTGTSNSRNNCVLVMQRNSDWTRYSLPANCFTVYREKLYFGDSRDTGYMYRMEVPDVYSDDGTAYTSYWTSKKISLNPLYKMFFKELWVTTDGTAGSLDLSYNFNDYDGTWTSATIPVTSTYLTNVYKVNLSSTFSRYFQFKIGNSSANDFRIKRLDILYDDVPGKE